MTNEEQQQQQNEDQHHKNLRKFSQAGTIAGSFWLFYGYWWLFVIYVNNYLWLFMIIMQLFIIINNYL